MAMGWCHASPWAAGVRGTAQLLLKNEAAAGKEFADLRSSAAPLLGGRLRPHCAPEVGRACLETGMTSETERHLRFAIKAPRCRVNPGPFVSFDLLSSTLADSCLGKLLEQSGRKAEAINAYQEFLGHFENSTAKLPQIAEAQAAR